MATTSTEAKSKNDDESTEDTSAITAEDIVSEFNTHWTYATGTYHPRWRNAWSITNNKRVTYGYEGTADTFIPLTFSIIESAKANVIGGRPKITFLPTTPDQDADTKILDSAVDYVWDKGFYQQRTLDWVDGALTYGTAMLMVTWDDKLDIPVARFIPVKDFWIDPTATSLEHAERDGLPCGYRYLTSSETLKARKYVNPDYDDSKPEGKNNQRLVNLYDHAAIDSAGEYNASATDATDKNMWQGSTLGDDAKTKQVEVIVRYRGSRKIEVINRKAIILDTDSEIEDIYPFAALYDFKDPSLFYGRGHVDILLQRQEELNDVDNQDTDNMSAQLDSMKWVDPTYAHLIPEIVSGPGVVLPIPQNMMGELQRPAYNNKAHEKREEIKQDMREAVGAGEVVQGVQAASGKTATEINTEQLNAGKRFDVMIQQMETGGFQRLAKLIFKFIQKYADKEFTVRTVGNDGVRFEKFLKEQYPGEWEPRIQLDASAKTEQAKSASLQGQMFAQYAQNPLINLMELTKLDMRKQYGLDDQEIELLLSNPGQLGEAQPSDGTQAPEQAMAGAMAPAGPPTPQMPATGPQMPAGAPAAPSNPMIPTQPDPNAPAPLQPADLIKLYAAAVAAGDTSLSDQITTALGFTPGPDEPLAVSLKRHGMAQAQLDTALSVQDQQHQHEQADIKNNADMLNHAMKIAQHQRSMETPAPEADQVMQ